ncbi:glycosyltransferase family 2 protein [Pinirhizobacter sp.]|uniref:glycosyltransferase family 2 protein n=1 Tax=Pinirhizobacter sp. TaxID=2950432 RepID=UPI002F3F7FE6
MSDRRVCAIVVTWHPDTEMLQRLVNAAGPQVSHLVVVDNGGTRLAARDGVTLLAQPVNVGLAAGFNVGIAFARAGGFDTVLLLDQDSEPKPGMVQSLIRALDGASAGTPIAAVGPVFQDVRENHVAPFVQFGFPLNRKIIAERGAPVPCDFLISSGSLIPLAVLDAVGEMDTTLFIDNVDLEWSCRAHAAGYALLGVPEARMGHRLGDGRRGVLGLGHVVVHGPTRLYYIMRNRVLLYRMPHVPRTWVAQDLLRLPVKFLIFALLVGPRWRNARAMLKGLADGIRGRATACPPG